MSVWQKLLLVLIFGLLFGALGGLCYLGALTLYIHFAPEPLATALSDLEYFAPLMGLSALVLGIVQALLNLWLYHKKFAIFWLVNIVLALIWGGLASFFAIWLVWTIITLLNLCLVWFYTILFQHQLTKATKDMPT